MTSTCHRRAPSEYPRLLADECERFIDSVYDADANLPIPTCPGWTAADVGLHVGQLYRWAAAHVGTGSTERISGSAIDMQVPADRSDQPDWMRAGLELLTSSLDAADPATPLWAWGSDKTARFWGRRMLFETTIHRADVELARGREPDVEPDTAIDGIDEFLDNLPHARYFAPRVDELRGTGERLALRATDRDVAWAVDLLPDRFEWSHDGAGDVRASVEGSVEDLLLFAYGRRAPEALIVRGDAELVDSWVANSQI